MIYCSFDWRSPISDRCSMQITNRISQVVLAVTFNESEIAIEIRIAIVIAGILICIRL